MIHLAFIMIHDSDELYLSQSIMRSEMCSLHLTHPSAHTLGAVGSRHCGARGAVGGSVPCSRVSPQFLPELGFEPTTLGYMSNALSIRPRLPNKTLGYDFDRRSLWTNYPQLCYKNRVSCKRSIRALNVRCWKCN